MICFLRLGLSHPLNKLDLPVKGWETAMESDEGSDILATCSELVASWALMSRAPFSKNLLIQVFNICRRSLLKFF